MFGFLKNLFPKSRSEILVSNLIDMAEVFGLPAQDVLNAREMLEYNEWEVGFDTAVTQLYEYSIPVNKEFIDLANEAMKEMKIDSRKYDFINRLVERKK